jgi:hypothetical protein
MPMRFSFLRSSRFSIAVIVFCAVAFAALLGIFPPWMAGHAGAAAPPRFALFVGRFHPILLHFPVALLPVVAALHLWARRPSGASIRAALAPLRWLACLSAVAAAGSGALLAQEGGYSGPTFDWHWRFGVALAGACLALLFLYQWDFPGAGPARAGAWLAALGILGPGAHLGGSLSHGENFLSEYAPALLKPILSMGPHAPASRSSGNTDAAADHNEDYLAARKVVDHYCTECHGSTKSKGDLRMQTADAISAGGKSGPILTPGKPDKSRIMERLLHPLDKDPENPHMPPSGKAQPTAADIDAIRRWIAAGAPGIPAPAPPRTASASQAARPAPERPATMTTATPHTIEPKQPMNTRTILTATLAAASLHASAHATTLPAPKPSETAALAQKINQLFSERCSACHKVGAEDEESPHFVDNLVALNEAGDIDLKKPEESELYRRLLNGGMPKTSKSEKKTGKKAVPFTPDENELVRAWITVGAPPSGPVPAIIAAAEGAKPPEAAAPTPPPPTPAAEAPPATTARKVVREGAVLAGALQDLLSLPPEDQRDTRYLSLAALHNNVDEISDADLKLAGDGLTKLLNSLSTNPKTLTFPPVGVEGVLRRIRLSDLGWSAALWDTIAGTYPYAINSGGLSGLGTPAHCAVPMVRAEWFASVASRPPFYDAILNIPKHVTELERRLGIDVNRNLEAGDAVRSGFTQSGISLQNRLVERHEIKAYAGAYWKSYDFRENAGRGRLADFPLGPESAALFGGAHAFAHAGGEIIFNLPNGFQAYMLANNKDTRLDGPAPIEIVSDRLDKTHRAQISNGLSCIACHDEGMKTLPPDELRATAGSAHFSPQEARLIERLFPPEEQIKKTVKEDAERFAAAMRQAGLTDKKQQHEPAIFLVNLFERDVTLAQAAADLGLEKSELDQKMEASGASLFDDKTALRGPGIPRVAFAEPFSRIAVRLGIGDVRDAANPPAEFTRIIDPHRDLQTGAARIAVELKTDKPVYRKGELMFVTVQTSEDAYIRLVYQDAEGKVKILLPNAAHDGRIKGGVPVIFGDDRLVNPETGKAFRLRVGPPYGEETLAAVVSNTAFTNDATVLAAARSAKGGLAGGVSKAKAKGVEVEIVDAVRSRTQEGRLGVARVRVITQE